MIATLRGLTSVERTAQKNMRLGAVLCFIAGAANAGGFLAVGQYTSHMTGVVSSVTDNLVLGQLSLALIGIASLVAFMAGAMTTAWMVNWAQRRALHSSYGRPLLLEAILLLVFGMFGASINRYAGVFIPLTVLVLCFIMGLQNALMTKISRAEIRTTHVTGLVTDLGIELGKLLYINGIPNAPRVTANHAKLWLQVKLLGSFFIGGVLGAIGFKAFGFIATTALCVLLLILVWDPIAKDAKNWAHPTPSDHHS